LELADTVLRAHLKRSLLPLLLTPQPQTLERALRHAALLSLQFALHALWREWGIVPRVVYGSGVGEYSAAAAAGVVSWETALVLAARRGRLLDGLQGADHQGVTLKQFKDDLARADYAKAQLPIVSAMRGGLVEALDAAHFQKHVYEVPGPGEGCADIASDCSDLQIGMGTAPRSGSHRHGPRFFASLDHTDPWRSLLGCLGQLYVAGCKVDWASFDAPYPRNKLSLPTYPFERERYWLDFPERATLHSTTPPSRSTLIERAPSHPLASRVRVRGDKTEAQPVAPDTQRGTGEGEG